jgi:hypothetical protein
MFSAHYCKCLEKSGLKISCSLDEATAISSPLSRQASGLNNGDWDVVQHENWISTEWLRKFYFGLGAGKVFSYRRKGGYYLPCHILSPRNRFAVLRTACLEFCLSGRLLQPVEATLCGKVHRGAKYAWRPTGGLPEAHWSPLGGQLYRKVDPNPKIKKGVPYSPKLSCYSNFIHRGTR